jgi:hypothetical protein
MTSLLINSSSQEDCVKPIAQKVAAHSERLLARIAEDLLLSSTGDMSEGLRLIRGGAMSLSEAIRDSSRK